MYPYDQQDKQGTAAVYPRCSACGAPIPGPHAYYVGGSVYHHYCLTYAQLPHEERNK